MKGIGLLTLVSSLILSSETMSAQTDYTGLKEIVGDDFKIGVAVGPWHMAGEAAELIKHNYNTMTAENVMKPASIIQRDGSYNFAAGDRIVEFARENGMTMRGHTLLWHASTPRGYLNDAEGNPLTKEQVYEKHEKYIKAVLEHYRGDVVFCWDVVNEALSDGEFESIYRESSPWYKACGPEYIAWAFRTARKYADDNVKLYYNDYNLVDPVKRERCYELLKGLVDAGVPIDGVGLQAHWSHELTEEMIQAAIDRFSSLGLDVHITELDFTVYDNFHGPGAAERQESKVTLPYEGALAERHAEKYEMIFRVLHKNSDKISSVTFWNIHDGSSWLNNFPIRGRMDYPLLFDREFKPKAPFFRIEEYYKSLK